MRDEVLMSVTRVLDDSTGIWAGDLCEFSIYTFTVLEFLREHKKKGADEIKSMLAVLAKKVDAALERVYAEGGE